MSQQVRLCVFRCVASAAHFFIIIALGGMICKGEGVMPDYKTMYKELFNKVTDVIEQLQEAQKKAK